MTVGLNLTASAIFKRKTEKYERNYGRWMQYPVAVMGELEPPKMHRRKFAFLKKYNFFNLFYEKIKYLNLVIFRY